MTMLLCSLDEGGKIIERFGVLPYSIVECALKGQRVTFKALDLRLASGKELDAKHKDDVEAIRGRFKWDLADTTASSALGWAMNLFAAAVGNELGLLVDVILFALPARRRALKQRWSVRRRVYWFTTQPEIPRLFRRKRGYRVRADTQEEARDILIREVVAKVWLVPRGCIRMILHAEDGFPELLDLEGVRKAVDRERWARTDPARSWGRPTGHAASDPD